MMLVLAFVIELVGIGCLVAALVEGVDNNPGMFLAPLGGCLLAAGGFLWVKVTRARGKRRHFKRR